MLKKAQIDYNYFFIESVKGNIDFKVKINEEQVDTNSWNPLLFAIYFKNLKVVKYLIEE